MIISSGEIPALTLMLTALVRSHRESFSAIPRVNGRAEASLRTNPPVFESLDIIAMTAEITISASRTIIITIPEL